MLKEIRQRLDSQGSQNSMIGLTSPLLLKDNELKNIIPLSNYSDINSKTKELILGAKHTIVIQVYNFNSGKTSSDDLIDALKKLQQKSSLTQQKVSVYILLNRRKTFAAAATGKLFDPRFNHPLQPLLALNTPNHPYFFVHGCYHEHSGFNSYHSKIIVVDGETSMLRGCDFGDSDRLETTIVINDKNISQALVTTIQKLWQKNSANTNVVLDSNIAQPPPIQSDTYNTLLLAKNSYNSATSYSTSQSPLKIALLTAIQSAQESVCIMTPNINDDDILIALSEAAKRGVTIRIYTGKHHNDRRERLWGGTNASAIKKLFQLCQHSDVNLDVRWAAYEDQILLEHSKRAMHAKCVVVDKQLVFTGSSALDKQALVNSNETDVCINSWEVAANFLDFFNRHHAQGVRYFNHAHNPISLSDIELDDFSKRYTP